jgi:UDP-3-O-[3-hydroxymyristoyl] glucosamine N-acyltransferase
VVVDRRVQAPPPLNLIRVDDPYAAITVLIVHLHGRREHPRWGISSRAVVADSAKIGKDPNIGHYAVIADNAVIGDDVTIYPGCYVGPDCRLGNEVVLFPNAVLYEHTILGHRVAIHAGTVVGNDGLGYAPVGGKWEKIPQIGYVEIGDDVEIGSNCSIDRATLGQTVIGSGTKFSNLIAVGHGAKVGADCMFVAQVGLAGSVSVGRHVTLAGQVGVAGHLSIGDDAQVAAKAGVMNDVKPGTKVLGQPAMPMNEAKRIYAVFTHLPEMRDRIKQLEAEVSQLRAKLSENGKSR